MINFPLFKLLVTCGVGIISTVSFAATLPNVIYILADDAGINNFGVYGGKLIDTPNIDSIARDGIKFNQHYAGSTVCAPSRSVLMTGKDTGRTRIRHNLKEATLLDSDLTLGKIFKRAGYQTAMMGKWGLGQPGSAGIPNNQGFDEFFGFLDHGNAHRYYPQYLWHNQKKEHYSNNSEQRSHYSHDLITQRALEFIDKQAATDLKSPFFLYLAFTVPHVDLDVPADSMAPYLNKWGDDSRPFFSTDTWGYKEHPTPKAAYAGMISRMDRDVGRVLAKLKQYGLDENTLVMFASDNGPSPEGDAPIEFFDSNGIYRGGKRDFYEGGIRMPFVAKWPAQIKAGRESEHISGFVDMVATMSELVQQQQPQGDGVSFLPTLLGLGEQQQHDYLYWEIESKLGLNVEKQAVRQGKWKLLRLSPWVYFSHIELYDLDIDPSEQHDISGDHPEVVARLTALMDKSHTSDADYPLRAYGE